jgi:hypothetical protein
MRQSYMYKLCHKVVKIFFKAKLGRKRNRSLAALPATGRWLARPHLQCPIERMTNNLPWALLLDILLVRCLSTLNDTHRFCHIDACPQPPLMLVALSRL